MVPLLSLSVSVLVVGTVLACALWFRSEGGWAVTLGRATGIPVVVASAQLLTFAYFSGLSTAVDSWPLTALAAIHGIGVVGGAALKQRRWAYVAAAGSITALGALLAASWGDGPGLHRSYPYLALVSVGLGLLPGFVTAGRGERSG